jgi:hypothetical protein
MTSTQENIKNDYYEGFIPLMRRFKEHPFWTEPRRFSRAECWIDLLFRAHYGEKEEVILDRGEEIIIKEGYVLTSIVSLASAWKRSRSFVRGFLSGLQNRGQISIIRMDNRRTILYIVKFGYFKSLIQQSRQQTEQQTGQQKSNRKTYKNKDNKENNILSKDNIDKKSKSFGNEKVNLILDTYKKYFGFTPTDRKPRFVAQTMIKNIEAFIKEAQPYKQYTFEEIVEKSFDWYSKRDIKGETLDVVRRKVKKLFELTLNKLKGGEKK